MVECTYFRLAQKYDNNFGKVESIKGERFAAERNPNSHQMESTIFCESLVIYLFVPV